MATNIPDWVCATRMKPGHTRGLADLTTLWTPGQDVLIGFLGGSNALRDRVFATAKRWTIGGPGGANLAFKRADDDSNADIRVAFDPDDGSWSHVGTVARSIAAGEPTMNLGWATEDLDETPFASVVLHEFGHAIGLLHEHNHPDLELRWKKHVVYAELGDKPNNWTKEDVDFNVFEQYPLDRVVMSDMPDRVSIMIYTIPARWLDGQAAIQPSDTLSTGDIEFIQGLYP
jgi:serralysin